MALGLLVEKAVARAVVGAGRAYERVEPGATLFSIRGSAREGDRWHLCELVSNHSSLIDLHLVARWPCKLPKHWPVDK